MRDIEIIWDDEDDCDGNYWHIFFEGHGLSEDPKIVYPVTAYLVPPKRTKRVRKR